MRRSDVIRAWGRILSGGYPTLSIEITRECPLRCPGCYAYEPEHLGAVGPLRSVADLKDQKLIDGVLELVDRHKPLHVSIVGGEPLVRFRELNVLLPILLKRRIAVQVVTSAVRQIPPEWKELKELYLAVSIDGLQPDHDIRRKPATYERIIRNIHGQSVTVHCTITSQMLSRPGYFEEFVAFWSPMAEVKKIWFSIFTPQIGAEDAEILSPDQRRKVLEELRELRGRYAKISLPDAVIEAYNSPPASPDECIFSRTTVNYTADLENRITPCQFGGEPDCSQCGCMASAGLQAVSKYRLGGKVQLGHIFEASMAVGGAIRRVRTAGNKNERAAGSL